MRTKRDVPIAVVRSEQRRQLSAAMKRLVNERGISQAGLARRVGTSRDNINGWYHGDTFPRRRNLLDKLAEVLDVTVGELVPDLATPTPTTPLPLSMIYVGNGKCRITIDMDVSVAIGTQIVQLVEGMTQGN